MKEIFEAFVESFQNGTGTILSPEGKRSDHAGMFILDEEEAIIVIVRRFFFPHSQYSFDIYNLQSYIISPHLTFYIG